MLRWGGHPFPRPTLTNAEAEETEDKVGLVKAAEDWPEREAHDGDEDDTQTQGQHHEAHAHVDENWGKGRKCPGVIPRHCPKSTSKFVPTDMQYPQQAPKV